LESFVDVMPPMASMKNTIVLGCFILVGFAMHAYLTRYESGINKSESQRFDKLMGRHEFYNTVHNQWFPHNK